MERSQVLEEILSFGMAEKASDWHIREGAAIGIRTRGEIKSLGILADAEFMNEMKRTMLTASILDKYERTGDADFAFEDSEYGRFRVNLHRQRGLMCMTMRHVKSEVPDIKHLKLPPVIHSIAEAKNGIVFVTGSTGSGKSTTLACMIEHINANRRAHIITVEDPIEYNFRDRKSIIEQREVGLDTISFDSALKHSLRQDPDIIVLGELRSRESVEAALEAAETGHLVMTTLHTNNAPQSIERILDFFGAEDHKSILKSLSSNLRAIICQRLVPKAIGGGVVPINEILINTALVRRLLLDGKIDGLEGAIASGEKDGMQSFNSSIMKRINDGDVDEETGLEYSSSPEALRMNLQGIFLSADGGIVS